MNKFSFSLRLKLFLLFLTFALVSLLAFGVFAYFRVSQTVTDQFGVEFQRLIENDKFELDRWMNTNKASLLAVGRSSIIQNSVPAFLTTPGDPALKADILQEFDLFLFNNLSFSDLFLMDPVSGRVLASSDVTLDGADLSNDPYFIRGKEAVFSTPIYHSLSKDRFSISLGAPIKASDGRLIGVLGADINVLSLNELLGNASDLPQDVELYLVSPDHQFLAGWARDLQLTEHHPTLESEGVDNAFIQGGQGRIYLNYAQKRVIGYHLFLPEINAAIILEQPISVAYGPFRTMVARGSLLALLVFAFSAILSLFVSRRITSPLGSLTIVAQKIAAGHHLKAEIHGTDEIARLAEAFNAMTDQLETSADWNKHILESMPKPLYVLDHDGIVIQTNKEAEIATGMARKEVVGQSLFDFFKFKDSIGKYTQRLTLPELFKEKNFKEVPALFSAHGHVHFPVDVSGNTIKDEKGREFHLVLVRDLREYIRYSHKKVLSLISVLNRISIGDFSQKPEIPDKGDEFAELAVAVDLMIRNLKGLMEENQAKSSQIEASRRQLEVSHEILKKAKDSIDAEKSKADALLGSIGEGIMAIDLRGNVMMMNGAAEKMFQRDTHKVLGTPFVKNFIFEDHSGKPINMQSEIFENVVAKQTQHFTTTYFTQSNAVRLPLATTMSPIMLGKRLIGIIGTFRDITRETEIDKAKSEFVSLASHQLRTPLTAVKWLLEDLMHKGGFNPMQLDHLDDIKASTERLITLVNDLLNVSRLESGVLTVEPKAMDLGPWVSNVVKEYVLVAKQKRQTVRFQKPAKPILLAVDTELYRQIFDNMISNAIKYSLDGKIITVALAKKKHGVVLSVQDQGIGMGPDEKKQMFTKFFRTAEASKFSTTSSGLGLYILKKILDFTGGSIEVETEKGKGTLMSVTYPHKGMIAKKGVKRLV